MAKATWVHSTDPNSSDLLSALPPRMHPLAIQRLEEHDEFADEAFPSLEDHSSDSTDNYLFGELAFPVFDPVTTSVGTLSIRLVIDFDRMVTVLRPPGDLPPSITVPDLTDLPLQAVGMDTGACMWLLLDRVADEIQKLVLETETRAEDVEYPLNHDREPPTDCRKQLAQLRNQFLQLGTIIRPTLSVVEEIIDDELDLTNEGQELFTRDTEIRLISVRNTLTHSLNQVTYWTENLRTMQDSLSDYLNREQTRSGNRLAAMASIMLLPTFLVGLYGMNIDAGYFPEFGWLNGYLLAWILIVVITVIQVVVFRRMGWLSRR
jgi:magnesium transporter